MNSGSSTSMSASSSDSRNGSSGELALKKGPWTSVEDKVLVAYVERYGEGNWNAVRKKTALLRCGKSSRLRWTNHLRPNLKKGSFTPEEERLIVELHSQLGNKWARMAAQLPGRTDNEIKNFWNTRIKRHLRDGLPLYPHSQKPRQTSSSQPFRQQSPVVNNHLLVPQFHTTPIPMFQAPFQFGIPGIPNVFDQTQSSMMLQDTSHLPIHPPRHKRYCDSISTASFLSNDGILQDTPSSFNLTPHQMEMGSMPSCSSFSVVNPELPSSQSQFPDPCFFSTTGLTRDAKPVPGIDPSHEDPLTLSDLFPSNVHAPTPESNCGRSIDTDTDTDDRDEFGLDIQEIASLFTGSSMAELGIVPWDSNMPEIFL